jgi:hypothetical protein
LVAGNTIRLVAQLPQVLDQRLEGAGIVDGYQAARTRVECGPFAFIVRRGAARRAISRPPTLLTPSH